MASRQTYDEMIAERFTCEEQIEQTLDAVTDAEVTILECATKSERKRHGKVLGAAKTKLSKLRRVVNALNKRIVRVTEEATRELQRGGSHRELLLPQSPVSQSSKASTESAQSGDKSSEQDSSLTERSDSSSTPFTPRARSRPPPPPPRPAHKPPFAERADPHKTLPRVLPPEPARLRVVLPVLTQLAQREDTIEYDADENGDARHVDRRAIRRDDLHVDRGGDSAEYRSEFPRRRA
uniref:Uncharacterized protein n=1 Tax=Marseillevirus LCMAC103 TaxID=2506604 RepID=A0A481YUI5_9VIRU|nr:MAG: hypothetical protein LCMAC103_03150 [Marseillevirus LCMAC103]